MGQGYIITDLFQSALKLNYLAHQITRRSLRKWITAFRANCSGSWKGNSGNLKTRDLDENVGKRRAKHLEYVSAECSLNQLHECINKSDKDTIKPGLQIAAVKINPFPLDMISATVAADVRKKALLYHKEFAVPSRGTAGRRHFDLGSQNSYIRTGLVKRFWLNRTTEKLSRASPLIIRRKTFS
uniref:Uncharacterized protein n=1 Tax=Toxocara canis TaxID=6265 RepID=A0A183TWU4_TOXCA